MAAPRKPAIVFCGFMGAGKSGAAVAAATALGEQAVDTDELIEARAGGSIAELFEREGEARFRELEREVVLEAVDRGGVVSVGGGAVETPEIREALATQVTVLCRVSEPVAWERAAGTGRPLATDREKFRRRYEARRPIYEELARVVLPRGGDQTPAVAAPWLAALRGHPGLRVAWARAGEAEYPAVVGSGADRLLEDPAAPPIGARLVGIVDRSAVAAGVPVPAGVELRVEADGGERSKSFEESRRVLVEMAELGVRRDDAVVAVGGGVVGDLAGFCAAVYQRGIAAVQVPTTLVAQVDSAYGGKTGVDLPAAKNYVGAYHQPSAVLADPERLRTLPEEELAAGFAEVVKTALIAGGPLWERVRSISTLDPGELAATVFDCAQTKLEVVASDERDGGRRKVLNLGHTVGHAIEVVGGYERYRHGEAVALGLLAALQLSGQEALREEVATIFEATGLPVSLDPAIGVDAVVEATGRDKKRTAEGLGFVLVRAPGEVDHDQPVGAGDLRAAVGDLTR